MLGVLATIAFALAYCAVAKGGAGLVGSLVAGLVIFAIVGAVSREFAIAPLPLYLACVVALVVAIRLVPAPRVTSGVHLPWWDLLARMVLATTLVIAITSAAGLLGPRLSGQLATIPLYASILAAFGHTLVGPAAAIRVWRGLLFGLFGFGTFYLMLALFLEPIGLAAFAPALAAAFFLQLLTLRFMRS